MIRETWPRRNVEKVAVTKRSNKNKARVITTKTRKANQRIYRSSYWTEALLVAGLQGVITFKYSLLLESKFLSYLCHELGAIILSPENYLVQCSDSLEPRISCEMAKYYKSSLCVLIHSGSIRRTYQYEKFHTLPTKVRRL